MQARIFFCLSYLILDIFLFIIKNWIDKMHVEMNRIYPEISDISHQTQVQSRRYISMYNIQHTKNKGYKERKKLSDEKSTRKTSEKNLIKLFYQG